MSLFFQKNKLTGLMDLFFFRKKKQKASFCFAEYHTTLDVGSGIKLREKAHAGELTGLMDFFFFQKKKQKA
jgi:hypothetical protein